MNKDINDLTFSEAYNELQSISTKLQDDTDDLDGLLEQVRTASKLINHCKQKLKAAESELNGILGEVTVVSDDEVTIETIVKESTKDEDLPF
ncbi:MAG: exodeoxyribonuclease VII small subunit [Ignavibacteria bacterium]|nr:exodeoxyribonuclease VII small subunit [Ignavibacteria bacterium]